MDINLPLFSCIFFIAGSNLLYFHNNLFHYYNAFCYLRDLQNRRLARPQLWLVLVRQCCAASTPICTWPARCLTTTCWMRCTIRWRWCWPTTATPSGATWTCSPAVCWRRCLSWMFTFRKSTEIRWCLFEYHKYIILKYNRTQYFRLFFFRLQFMIIES